MSARPDPAPLAERVRPRTLEALQGQPHLLGAGRPLPRMLAEGRVHSMVLWGPPGTGKTTLVRVIASTLEAQVVQLSAVNSGVKEIRAAIDSARQNRERGRTTVLFVDEVHRFNKAQQDGFLPYIEDGTIIFIGATTENPAFELNNALLSRLQVHVLEPLAEADLIAILERALLVLNHEREAALALDDSARHALAACAGGDARAALNLLETLAALHPDPAQPLTAEQVALVASGPAQRFDKQGDLYYDQISALHKSVRGSNPDATLYWLSRMLQGGMSPTYIARRLVRIASEDVGNADPRALGLTLDAWDAWERLGSPEGELALAHAAVYLACCSKSNAVYKAFKQAWKDAESEPGAPVPPHLRNAPTRLAKELGHGKEYRYSHDEEHGYSPGQNYFPETSGERRYYHPVERGLETRIKERLDFFNELNRRQHQQRD